MRAFSGREALPVSRVLLVESGPRSAAETLVRKLRTEVCPEGAIDLFTCLPDQPRGLGTTSRAWRSYNAGTGAQRWRTVRELRRERHGVVAILCSGSPILAGWKLALAALLPARVLLAHEDQGLVWLDLRHWREAARIASSRSRLRDPKFLRQLAHAAALPFTVSFLLAFAVKAHLAALARTASGSPGEESPRT